MMRNYWYGILEEARNRHGVELTDWVLDRIMDELGWVRPVIEIEIVWREIDRHIGMKRGNHD